MKYTYIILIALLVAGCRKKAFIEFTGNTPGIKNGVFIVKTPGDSAIYGENIKDGKFTLTNTYLKVPGYYTMKITDADNNDNHEPFEIYLEDGKYTFETEAGKLNKYPKITSSSKTQEQLSAFYTMFDKISADANQEVKKLNLELKTNGNKLSNVEYSQLLNELGAAETKMITNNIIAFKEFVKQYPNSDISTHLMSKLNYEDDPAGYYAIYKTLSPAAKNTDEGKEIGDKLNHLIKLVVGVKAPAIYGKMPDGKPFDQKSITKKYILIDFWRAGNDFSRRNHQKIIDILGEGNNQKKLEIVSVSLDTRSDWWTNAVGEDHMTWPQVSDLKGDDSPNVSNWSITTIPTYYLLDSNWNIVERNINIGTLEFEVADYIEKHP
jgi:Thioredoxin-like